MKQIKGLIKNIDTTVIGKFCTYNNIFKSNKVLACSKKPLFEIGINAYIVPKGKVFKTNKPIIETDDNLPFVQGDIINITPCGTATVIWEADTPHHALYVTDVCNSKCIMCPQIEGASTHYDECMALLDLVDFKGLPSIGITGGEPTLNINKLIDVLTKIAKKSPGQKVHILTNGRNFARKDVVEKIASVKGVKVSYGIPLYSDIAEEHDYIVGVKGAFVETIQGIYNLGRYNQNIEIRTVILRQNYSKLKSLATYIYRNMPFVNHIALMSMEYHGNAEINYNLVAIDPVEYKTELFEAVREYVRYNMVVDVYNTPLCLVDSRIKEFCKDSISTWKKTYLPQCESCIYKSDCSGVFETSFKHSEHIKPIEATLICNGTYNDKENNN